MSAGEAMTAGGAMSAGVQDERIRRHLRKPLLKKFTFNLIKKSWSAEPWRKAGESCRRRRNDGILCFPNPIFETANQKLEIIEMQNYLRLKISEPRFPFPLIPQTGDPSGHF